MAKTLADSLLIHFPWQHETAEKIRMKAMAICHSVIEADLLDKTAEGRLLSDDPDVFWPVFSEVLLANELLKSGLKPSHREPGPDFLIEQAGKKIWIEVITPSSNGIPIEWITPKIGEAQNMPADSILLRWTAAIKEKAEKLLGQQQKADRIGYLKSGIVDENDAYVIAINGFRLRNGPFPNLMGISQFPFAAEAAFAVGPYSVAINRDTMEISERGHQHRPRIQRQGREAVPSDTFHDCRFAPISAIWAVDISFMALLDQPQPMSVVHNPYALNPIPLNMLPAQTEYTLEVHDKGFSIVTHDRRDR